MSLLSSLRSTTLTRLFGQPRQLAAHLLAAALIFTLAYGATSYRLSQAPDVFTDEAVYARVAIRLHSEGALIWDTGNPVVIHPPLFFLAESLFLSQTADPVPPPYTPGDIFATVYQARLFNALLAGLTAVLLYGLGTRLGGARLGLLLAALFVLDPFGVRVNRRAMIETMATLLSLAGLALILTQRTRERRPLLRAILAGLLMGAGLLTKELTFLYPLAVAVFGALEVWRGRRVGSAGGYTVHLAPFLATGVAGLTYSLFPLWVLTTGHWARFVAVKSLALQRLLGLVHTSGWNRPGLSLVDFLIERLVDYGSSYGLLALGGLATVLILVFGRQERAGRFLSVWGVLLYPFFAFLALFGSGNDQFFYFLLLPAIILVGYALTTPFALGFLAPLKADLHALLRLNTWPWRARWPTWQQAATGVLLLFLLPFNFNRWWVNYGVGTDNGYYQLSQFVQVNIPRGAPVNASGDSLKFKYFLPHNPVGEVTTPEEARQEGVQYFVLAPKDLWARYGQLTEELATWILSQGTLMFQTSGASYGEIRLYDLSAALADAQGLTPGQVPDPTYARTFPVAETGWILPFLMGLLVWVPLWLGIGVTLEALWQARFSPAKRRKILPKPNVVWTKGEG